MCPEDMLLQEMGIEGYLGTPLFASDGKAIGLVGVLSIQPLHPSHDALDILSARAAVELEPIWAEEGPCLRALPQHPAGGRRQRPGIAQRAGPCGPPRWHPDPGQYPRPRHPLRDPAPLPNRGMRGLRKPLGHQSSKRGRRCSPFLDLPQRLQEEAEQFFEPFHGGLLRRGVVDEGCGERQQQGSTSQPSCHLY